MKTLPKGGAPMMFVKKDGKKSEKYTVLIKEKRGH
jgi:hypothetical protein